LREPPEASIPRNGEHNRCVPFSKRNALALVSELFLGGSEKEEIERRVLRDGDFSYRKKKRER